MTRMKKHVYLYAVLFCLSIFLPSQSFAAKNAVSLFQNNSASYVKFGGYEYRFDTEVVAGAQFRTVYIERSANGTTWERIDQTFENGAEVTNTVVYKGAFYFAIQPLGDYSVQIWKTTDGEYFTNVIDGSDSLYDSSIDAVGHFFTVNEHLCTLVHIHRNSHPQSHCSSDGDSWTSSDVTGYMYNKYNRIKEVHSIMEVDGTAYALVEKRLQSNNSKKTRHELILLASENGADWRVVLNNDPYLSYKTSDLNIETIRFNDALYYFVPSKDSSWVRILTLQDNQLVPVEHEGLEGVRNVKLLTFGADKESIYIYGKILQDGKMQRCLYTSSDIHNWTQGECFREKNTAEKDYYNAYVLSYINEKLFLNDKDVTF